jgi:hypothetical protein
MPDADALIFNSCANILDFMASYNADLASSLVEKEILCFPASFFFRSATDRKKKDPLPV